MEQFATTIGLVVIVVLGFLMGVKISGNFKGKR